MWSIIIIGIFIISKTASFDSDESDFPTLNEVHNGDVSIPKDRNSNYKQNKQLYHGDRNGPKRLVFWDQIEKSVNDRRRHGNNAPNRGPWCPHGWIHFKGYCYAVYDLNLNYQHSEDMCISHGGHLASVHSAEENEFLIKQIARPQKTGKDEWGKHAWLGLYSISDGPNFSWRWSDGTKVDYSDIIPYPPEIMDERCVTLMREQKGVNGNIPPFRSRQYHGWNTFFCEKTSLSAICKKPAKVI